MKDKKCINCGQYRNCRDSLISWVFFVIGIIATVAVRVVTILMEVNPVHSKIAWYIGVGGFLFFFIYKFKVDQSRAKAIVQRNIMNKLTYSNSKQLTEDDYTFINKIFCGLSSKKQRVNYLVIAILSAVALIFALYVDFLK